MIYKQIFLEVHYVAAVKFKKEWLLLLPSLICYSLLFGFITFFAALPPCSQEVGGWKQVNYYKEPYPRSYADMVYDSKRQVIVMIGGYGWHSYTTGNYLNSEIWEYNGIQWKYISEAPTVNSRHSIAYDADRDKIVMFGGTEAPSNTYEWDRVKWEIKNPAIKPDSRIDHRMVYDPNKKRTILFGGRALSASLITVPETTWEWDGNDWWPVATIGPSPRWDQGMVYDTERKRVVLFGGTDGKKVFNDTWEWDGNKWYQLTAHNSPSPRTGFMMTYDSQRKKTILFGGYNFIQITDSDCVYFNESWEWDGNLWSLVDTNGPGYRGNGCLCYDRSRNKTILFGGEIIVSDKGGGYPLGDTWEYTPKTLPIPEKTYKLDSESEFTRMSGGFMNAQAGSVEVGSIPVMEGFSDGKGVTLTAGKGQVELLMFPSMDVGDNMIMLRASVQSNNSGAALALAALDGGMDGSIATNQPANSQVYLDKYQRMVVVYDPPGNTIVPIFQLANLSNLIPVTVYLDNIEIFLLPREDYRRFYGE